jgi:hypothetical protein
VSPYIAHRQLTDTHRIPSETWRRTLVIIPSRSNARTGCVAAGCEDTRSWYRSWWVEGGLGSGRTSQGNSDVVTALRYCPCRVLQVQLKKGKRSGGCSERSCGVKRRRGGVDLSNRPFNLITHRDTPTDAPPSHFPTAFDTDACVSTFNDPQRVELSASVQHPLALRWCSHFRWGRHEGGTRGGTGAARGCPQREHASMRHRLSLGRLRTTVAWSGAWSLASSKQSVKG